MRNAVFDDTQCDRSPPTLERKCREAARLTPPILGLTRRLPDGSGLGASTGFVERSKQVTDLISIILEFPIKPLIQLLSDFAPRAPVDSKSITPARGQGCYRAAAGSGRSELGKRSSFTLAQRAKASASPELPCERRPGPAERSAHAARESPRLGSSPVLNESPLTMRFCGWSCPFYSKRAERRPGGPITRRTSADRAEPTSCTSSANGCLRPQTPDLREKHRTHRTAHGTPQVGMSRGGGGNELGSLPIRQISARDHGFKTPRLPDSGPPHPAQCRK